MINLNEKVLVLNHEDYKEFTYGEDIDTHFVLNILDTTSDEYSEKYIDALYYQFKTNPNIQRHKVFKINDDDSSYIHQYNLLKVYVDDYKEFIDAGFNIDFIASCKGGVSRSPAIAAAILRYFRKNGYIADEMMIFKNGKYTPNMHVFKLCCKALKVPVTKEELDKFESINLEAWKKVHAEDLE